MKHFFSIVLPTFNQADFLRKSLNSILNQSYKDWELIIVDNNSTDHTTKVIEENFDKRFRVYKINNKNILAKSRNLGIKKSKSDWVCFIDTDDIWYPNKLETVKKYIEKTNGDIFYHDLDFTNKYFLFQKKRVHDKSQTITKPILKYFARHGNGIGQSTVVVKKKLLRQIGYISENKEKFSWEDFDTWIRLSKKTDRFIRIPKTLGSIWVGPEQISGLKRQIINSVNIDKYYGKIFKKLALTKTTNNLWWQEYPYILRDFREKRNQECLNRIKSINRPNLRIYLIVLYIKFKLSLIQIFKKIFSLANIIILFKNSKNKYFELPKKCLYRVVSNPRQLNNIKFKNFNIPSYFYNRLETKKKFHYICSNGNLISYGWSSLEKFFLITEINCKVVNKGIVIFFDFNTLKKYRRRGFYKLLLSKMQVFFKSYKCFIYTNVLNFKSFFGINKSNFKIFKILTPLTNKINLDK